MHTFYQRSQLLLQLAQANERAEKAEAEIAALKARIDVSVDYLVEHRVFDTYEALELTNAEQTQTFPFMDGKRVRLVVEE